MISAVKTSSDWVLKHVWCLITAYVPLCPSKPTYYWSLRVLSKSFVHKCLKRWLYNPQLEFQLMPATIIGLRMEKIVCMYSMRVCVSVWAYDQVHFVHTQTYTLYPHTKLAFYICQYSISVSYPNTLSPTLTPTHMQSKCQEIIRCCFPHLPFTKCIIQ